MAGRPKGTAGKARVLTTDEIDRIDGELVGSMMEHRNRALLHLGVGSGLRVGEMCELVIGDILDCAIPVASVRVHGRTVDVPTTALDAIIRYLLLCRPDRADHAAPLLAARAAVRGRHRKLKTATATAVLSKMFEAASVDASSHSLRRTYARRVRLAGATLEFLQSRLGLRSLDSVVRCLGDGPSV